MSFRESVLETKNQLVKVILRCLFLRQPGVTSRNSQLSAQRQKRQETQYSDTATDLRDLDTGVDSNKLAQRL